MEKPKHDAILLNPVVKFPLLCDFSNVPELAISISSVFFAILQLKTGYMVYTSDGSPPPDQDVYGTVLW